MTIYEATNFTPTTGQSLQSANVFLHCMRNEEYLKTILLNHAFIPRYNIEDISYLQLSGYDQIAVPMVCFCDIFINRLRPHMEKYGKYGIGMKKDCLIEKGLNPIFYVNPESFVSRDFSHILQLTIDKLNAPNEYQDEDFLNYQMFQLLYTKPLSGRMRIQNEIREMNFHDECEWRYIPDMNGTDLLPFILDEEIMDNGKALNRYNEALSYYMGGRLSFSYNDIKYIIVEKESERLNIIDFIMNKLDIDEQEKYIMLSKIIAYKDLEGDF